MRWRALTGNTALLLCLLPAALLSSAARAEVLDELAVFPDRNDAVIRITFSGPVQYLRHEVFGDALVELYFRPLTAEPTPATEARRVPPAASFPGVEVVYPQQPRSQTRKLTLRLSSPLKLRVRPADDHAIDFVVAGAAARLAPAGEPPAVPVARPAPVPLPPAPVARPAPPAVAPVPAAPAPAVPTPAAPPELAQFRFLIRLATFLSREEMQRASPVPGEFSSYEVQISEAQRNGRREYDLVLGYFPSAEAARAARRRLLQRFPRAEVVDLGAPGPTIAAAPKPKPEPALAAAPKPKPTPVPAAPALPRPSVPAAPIASAEIEASAAELLSSARAALEAGNDAPAIDSLNKLLMLPPNSLSRDAQELMGFARERAGEVAKARAEYELYLKLYPEGAGAARVRERLAALAALPVAQAPVRAARAPERTVTGALSQYYYGGRTKIETAFDTPTTPDRSTFSGVDQSTLVTNADLSVRNRSAEADSRFVFRDTNSKAFLENQRSYNRLTAAYYDYRSLQNGVSARVGRQSGLSGGLPGRFDGAVAGYGLAQKWRANAAVGRPVEYPQLDAERSFWSANLEYQNLADAWSGNFYYVEQESDGLLDRRAVGTETRYFSARTSLFSVLDYDTSYKQWNVTMVQATYQTEGRTTINLLYDKRRAPTLSTTNAIFGQGTTSLKTLLQTFTEDQLRQQALDITATSTQGVIGFTTPVGKKWQMGADVRLTKVGALPSVEVNGIIVPAQPATGDIYNYSLQAIGSNLYSGRDTSVYNLTYLDGPTQTGYQLSYNNLTALGAWTLEPSLRYYTQKDNQGIELERWTPSLRITYQAGANVALESEYSWERTVTVGPSSRDETRRGFYYLGYRWNF
ncbi:MAG TPA: hypothetical protein VLA30_12910 [Burkholderiales bacterium]|nr:hypothetical protein [Burkholderiales bacterium]